MEKLHKEPMPPGAAQGLCSQSNCLPERPRPNLMGEGKGKEDNPCTNAHRWQRAGVSGPARRSVVIQLSQVKSQTLGEGESEGAKCGAQEQPGVGFTSKPCLLSSQGLGGVKGQEGWEEGKVGEVRPARGRGPR